MSQQTKSMVAAVRSQVANVRVFRPFFPLLPTAWSALIFPLQYLGDGRARRFPTVVDLNVTNRCNQRCEFCYNRDNASGDELSLGAIYRLLDEAQAHGSGVFLSGGEPFLRSDVVELIHQIKRRRLPVGVVTNGTMTPRVEEVLAVGPDVAVVSLHGNEPEHDAITGTRGSFERAWKCILALSRGMRPPGPLVNVVLHPEILGALDPFLARLATLSNVVVRLAHLSFLTDAEATAHKTVWRRRFHEAPPALLNHNREPNDSQYSELQSLLTRHRGILTKPILSKRELALWYCRQFGVRRRCLFIWQSTVVNANGDVLPCQYYDVPMGNIREQSLESIWNNTRYRKFRRVVRSGLLPGCARCCKL